MHLFILAAALSGALPAPLAQDQPAAASAAPAVPAEPCATAGGLLPGSGLCRDAAMARLPSTRRNAWTPPIGCDTTAQEIPLGAGRWLLYAAQRCGEAVARLEAAPGPSNSQPTSQQGVLELRYAAAARSKVLPGKRALTLVEGKPAPYEAVHALVMNSLSPKQVRDCALRTPDVEGYPIDALVFDLPPAEARKTAALDEPCGPYGRSARTDSYWRLFDGIGVFYAFGDDQPEFDPASLTVYTPGN
ncbi:hypothetical protein [Novosphingobium sp. PASSN1]|uniref:hypothetical protein n=1 Tax=Novosphingobium sp. PASSN1 TaxID=2015561 RepID=UPI000BDA3CFD|nr:hypothetical protein [Novosphingobium sp. PASSN1]OYU33198.1 MAG: hypothetical protein CFE35_21470 [Novosphingobium sp. PASSN1]